jgi:hypothetical protein
MRLNANGRESTYPRIERLDELATDLWLWGRHNEPCQCLENSLIRAGCNRSPCKENLDHGFDAGVQERKRRKCDELNGLGCLITSHR